MTTIFNINNFSESKDFVFFTNDLIESNPVVTNMYKMMHQNSTVLMSLNYFNEIDPFIIQNIHFEAIKETPNIDGYVTDQCIVKNELDENFLRELSKIIQQKYLIIGPSFSNIPYFLQSKNLEIAIKHNVTAVMYDVRDLDFKIYNELKPLAQLKSFARKRIEIIPVVNSIKKRDELLALIPFKSICILD